MKKLIVSLIVTTAFLYCQIDQPVDLKEIVSPLGIAPNPQNGYGDGIDQLAQPDDVEFLSDGTLLVSDVDNNRIQHFSTDGKLLNSITANELGIADPNIIPTGISSDEDGYIYISLEGAGTVVRLTTELKLDQFIGQKCDITANKYYSCKHRNCLIMPQGLIVSAKGDVYVIDMAKKVFKVGDQRNFGFKKFKKITKNNKAYYKYDKKFARTQEITKIMRKSEGMAIYSDRNLLLIAEEKPSIDQFGNSKKKRYVAEFDLKTGKFVDELIGVERVDGNIIDGYFYDSVEGLAILNNLLLAVDEKAGKVYMFDLVTKKCLGFIGTRAYYYCDDNSDCVIDGINYNEQSIIAGTATPHLLNSWQNNEIASPDGVTAYQFENGQSKMAIVDQWNSRILLYDLDEILEKL